ncbi:acyl-CoA dehydrogenase [Streptomyces sp. NPDC002580]|uniref:acyl-CoA dehydrogenase n=1 Tax=Streptomyces sp. NPDC002580 TaxID=3364653 RepID=UPI0036B02B1A
MGIAITPEQRELAEAVRGWIARAVPPGEVRKLLDAPDSGRPPFWDALAAQGLLAAHLPEAYGGGGGDLVDLAVVVEEAARAALPGPFVASVLASAVLAAEVSGGPDGPGGTTGRGDLVRALGCGALIGAVAFGAGSLTSRAVDGGYVLDGTAPPVLSGADADVLVLAAADAGPAPSGAPRDRSTRRRRAARGDAAPAGVLWLVVDAADLAVRPHESADPTRATAEVRAEGVRVRADRLLAVGPSLVRDLAAVVLAADACGTAAWALDTAVGHARTREQFGRPIGKFQAVKHLCADMLVRLEQARALAWDAARAGQEPSGAGPGSSPAGREASPLGREASRAGSKEGSGTGRDEASGTGQDPSRVRELVASLAAGVALDAACSCAKDCVQVLGGIGFTWEHDAHLYLRRAVVARQLLGAGSRHLRRAARLARAGVRRELRLELPPEASRHRDEARAVIEGVRGLAPAAVRRELAPTGYAAPHLPPPHGLGAGPVRQLAVQQELAAAGVRISDLGIATWVVPSLIAFGTGRQRERYLPPTLRGDLLWCQLFSEPGAGSDLAALRTRAERTDDGRWRINGQKVWTSAARWADHGVLLARTDPTAPRHKGLTYFVVDMKNTPGIDIRPLREITGDALFNEVYFDDVLLPADAVVGEVDDGWRVARNTLGNERVHMADQLTFDTGLEALIRAGAGAEGDVDSDADGAVDDSRLGALLAEAHALACIGLRTTLRQVSGVEPGAGASVRKLVQTAHQQKVAELGLELLGPQGALREGPGERAVHGFLLSRCLTIAGGTTQVQLNVVAERILGLPRD